MEGGVGEKTEIPGNWRVEKMIQKENQSSWMWHVERSYKNGKWGPQIQSIRCQVDMTFKNEAIITEIHLTELRCKSPVMITLVQNHKIKCLGDLSLCSSYIPQL